MDISVICTWGVSSSSDFDVVFKYISTVEQNIVSTLGFLYKLVQLFPYCVQIILHFFHLHRHVRMWGDLFFTHHCTWLTDIFNVRFMHFTSWDPLKKTSALSVCLSLMLYLYKNTFKLFIIPSPTKLRRDTVTLPFVLPSVRQSFRNILVNTLESTSFNGFWPNWVHP